MQLVFLVPGPSNLYVSIILSCPLLKNNNTRRRNDKHSVNAVMDKADM